MSTTLYTVRFPMKHKGVLELDTRKTIYDYIASHPGCHFRALYRGLKLPTGVVDYHLKYMEDKELIVSKRSGGYKRYYIRDTLKTQDKDLLGILRQKTLRDIIIYILLNKGASHGEIKSEFNISASTFSYHINKIVQSGCIFFEKIGRKKRYYVKNPEEVALALVTYKKGFADDVVDSFEEAWMDIHI